MDTEDALREIRCYEDDGDWESVKQKSLELVKDITSRRKSDVPHAVYHYIDDFDIRQKDKVYAAYQRSIVDEYLAKFQLKREKSESECNYEDQRTQGQ